MLPPTKENPMQLTDKRRRAAKVAVLVAAVLYSGPNVLKMARRAMTPQALHAKPSPAHLAPLQPGCATPSPSAATPATAGLPSGAFAEPDPGLAVTSLRLPNFSGLWARGLSGNRNVCTLTLEPRDSFAIAGRYSGSFTLDCTSAPRLAQPQRQPQIRRVTAAAR